MGCQLGHGWRRLLLMAAVAVAVAPAVLSSQRAERPERRGDGVRPLVLGAPIDRDLRGNESHAYELTLHADDYAEVIVEQRGIDVVVTLSTPEGDAAAV